MSNFRQCFDDYLLGRVTIDATASALSEDLQRQPDLTAVYGAFIEAMYRGSALSGDGYEALMRHINAAQLKRKTAIRSDSGDKTVFQPRKPGLRQNAQRANPAREPAVAGTDSSITSGSVWSDPAQWTATGSGPIGVGSIVKGRFVLESRLGKGGMGIVYKARDLRKEEAQDRNPYVAIKTLNEDFKRHPQALRALQREARKAQTLAHPNIVTVYDFDRDGTNVYMVMELLEGEPLDRLIKGSGGVGVGSAKAWRIALEICRGMAFAHQRGIVHADFKPANVFLTRNGAVKIFDFGIARAVKRGERGGAFTVFDPATLGALTPAYASCEVIEGMEPDARDDVYAIGCVIYELLTGAHPFERMSADVAREANAVPVRPAGLSWWRWFALRRALDFRRDQRPASAVQLLDAFRGVVRPTVRQMDIAAAVVAVVAAIAIGNALLPKMLARDRDSSLVAALASADRARIDAVLPELRELEGTQRAALFLDDAARMGLIRYFKTRIDAAIDVGQGRYDYPEAESLLRELQGYLADSLAVRELADRLVARKNEEIRRQSDRLDQCLARGVLIPEQESLNVAGVLEVVRSIDPRSRLLSDPRLPGAFARQARMALQSGNTALADALVTRGLSLRPGDAMLMDLRDKMLELRRAQRITEAGRMLESGRAFGADPTAVLAEDKLLAQARTRQELDDEVRARAAQLAALKEKLLVQAQANQIMGALVTLEQLRANLPKKDAFVSREAPRAIARSYLRIASTTVKEGRFKEAISLVDRARDLDESSEQIAAVRKRYVRYQAIDGMLATRRSLDVQDIRKELAELAKPDPDEAAVVMGRLARTLVTRINTTQDVEAAARLAAVASTLFRSELTAVRQADTPAPVRN